MNRRIVTTTIVEANTVEPSNGASRRGELTLVDDRGQKLRPRAKQEAQIQQADFWARAAAGAIEHGDLKAGIIAGGFGLLLIGLKALESSNERKGD